MALFYNKIKCGKCSHVSHNFEPFLCLQLPIPQNDEKIINLSDCLTNYMKCEELDKNNYYSCEVCKDKTNANICQIIQKLPKILIIQFKRFNYINGNWKKNNNYIDFKINFNFSKMLNSKNANYKLYSIINHLGGSIDSGHYINYSQINDKWYNFDDSNINELDESTIFSKNAYILFYKKLN